MSAEEQRDGDAVEPRDEPAAPEQESGDDAGIDAEPSPLWPGRWLCAAGFCTGRHLSRDLPSPEPELGRVGDKLAKMFKGKGTDAQARAGIRVCCAGTW